MQIEKIANAVVIVAAVVVIGLNVYDRFSPPLDATRATAQALVGKTLDLPQPLTPGSRLTAVLFVRKGCHFCSESMPFYLRLSALRTRGSSSLRLLAITPSGRESVADSRQYFADHGVPVDGIGQMQFDALGIRATPAIALLNGSRHVVKVWTGAVPSTTGEEIVRTIRNLCPDCSAS
jgi:hypothetical protein